MILQSDGVGGILGNRIHIASLHVRSEISINVYIYKVVLYIYICTLDEGWPIAQTPIAAVIRRILFYFFQV